MSVLAFVAVVARSKAFADTLQRTGCVCAFVRVLVCLMFAAFEGKALGPKARGWPSHEHFFEPAGLGLRGFLCVCVLPPVSGVGCNSTQVCARVRLRSGTLPFFWRLRGRPS